MQFKKSKFVWRKQKPTRALVFDCILQILDQNKKLKN